MYPVERPFPGVSELRSRHWSTPRTFTHVQQDGMGGFPDLSGSSPHQAAYGPIQRMG